VALGAGGVDDSDAQIAAVFWRCLGQPSLEAPISQQALWASTSAATVATAAAPAAGVQAG
jgi:hypothetical protein